MFLVVVGARERKSPIDEAQVVEVLNRLKTKYGTTMMVTSVACDQGIGSFVKKRCLQNTTDFAFLEITQRIYADLPRSRMIQVFIARNAILAELGDEFHIFVDPNHHGTMEDLIKRIERLDSDKDAKRVVTVYEPGLILSTEE
jgi:predicted RNase H-related nuclease YkuK (DUF458 family)